METTELFVELIVIGYGTLFWLLFLITSFLGYSWINFDKIPSVIAIVPSLVLAYVLGILVDRLADWSFRTWDRKIRMVQLTEKSNICEDYQRVRTIVFDSSESLRDWFYYGRSRVRICRGWAINFIFILVTANLFTSMQLSLIELKFKIYVILNSIISMFLLISVFSWHRLTSSEYERLAQEYKSQKTQPEINL
jgi:hypothetical protein